MLLPALPQAFHPPPRERTTCGISRPFERLSPTSGQVTHVLLTRSPLTDPGSSLSSGDCYGFPCSLPSSRCSWDRCVRLACIRHAASVHPEPGSSFPSPAVKRTTALTRRLPVPEPSHHSSVIKAGLGARSRLLHAMAAIVAPAGWHVKPICRCQGQRAGTWRRPALKHGSPPLKTLRVARSGREIGLTRALGGLQWQQAQALAHRREQKHLKN